MSLRTFRSLVAIVVGIGFGLTGPAAAQPRQPSPPDHQFLVATPAGVLFELALDEVELFWSQIPSRGRIPSISTGNVAGASVLSQRAGQAVIKIAKVAGAAELQDVAKALQRANPDAVVKPVFYETSGTSTGSRRRIGTNALRLVVKTTTTPESLVDPSAVTIRPVPEPAGTYVLETSDPMAALALTMKLRGRPDVTSVAISAVPERVLRKHERLTAGGKVPGPFDEPEKAQEYFALKRQPVGETAVPAERYLDALEHMKLMPRRSPRTGATMASAPENENARTAILGTWNPLGPGNIGGRTRGIVIDPNGTTFYAGGVAGGVWKSTNSGASWTPTSDLLANLAIGSLAIDPSNANVLYAGTGEGYFNGDAVRGNGIFKTTNAAASWAQLPSTANSDFFFVNKLVVSPNSSSRVYAATRTGVFRSLNGGASWTKVLTPTTTTGCTDLVIRTDQAADSMLAACGASSSLIQGTIYRNTDAGGGGTWNAVLGAAQGETAMGRSSLAIARSNQNVVYVLSANNAQSGDFGKGGLNAVFRSTDGGQTWEARVRNTNATKLNRVLLTNPVFAFNTDCGFGATGFFNQGWYDNVIAVDPADSDRVWVGGIDLFRSDDGGANWGLASYWWAASNTPHYAHADQHVIVFHPGYDGGGNKTLFVGNDGGLFRTTDARAAVATGATAPCNPNNTSVVWSNLNNGYAVTQFYHGLPYPSGTTYFAGAQDNGTVRGNDGAPNSWGGILGGDGGYVAVDPSNTNNLYAELQNADIRKSTNGGTTFVDATNGITEPDADFLFITPFTMDPTNSQRLWTGGFNMWRTANGATNWTAASSLLCGVGSVSAIAVAPTNADRVIVGMSDGCINRTTIGTTATGSTAWSVSRPGVTGNAFVSWLAYDPTNADVVYATYSTFGVPHVWKSTDGGATWSAIGGTGVARIPDIPVHSIVVDPANTQRLFVGTDVGVFMSDDGGGTWAVENTGFANVITEALAIGNVSGTPHVFAFTHGRGAWRTPVAAPVAQLQVSAIANSASFHPGQRLDISVGANNPGFAVLADVFIGVLAPDGNTLVFLINGATGVALGTLSNVFSYQPIVTGLSLAASFNIVAGPIFSYTWTGAEPTGTYTLFVEARRAGTTELLGRGQTSFTVTP